MLAGWEEKLRTELSGQGIASFFVIDEIPDDDGVSKLERDLTAYSGRIALVAWRDAERNLDFPAVLLFRLIYGKRLVQFRKRGGIEGMLMRTRRRVEKRITILGGAATLAVCAPLTE